jgi:drug/metabolite transporter (DMT)-like permease
VTRRCGNGADVTIGSRSVPVDAFLLALAAAFLHALWNVLLARESDVHAATAVAMVSSVVVFAPLAALRWDVDARVWPYIAVTAVLQLVYFVLLAVAYDRAELSFVYPIARGVAPVIVLVAGAAVLGAGASPRQALGVVLVGGGVILVRGLAGPHDRFGLALGLSIAAVIAGYTLVDKQGIRYADPVVYLELGMAPAALAYATTIALAHRGGRQRLRSAARPRPVAAGLLSFGAYALVLAALSLAAAASVAAVRETSVLIATALAWLFLGERVGKERVAGATLVVLGVALVALE